MGIYVVVIIAAGLIFTQLGVAVGVAYLIAATLFLPAMIILLVTTGSLHHAINPLMFVTLAMRIGRGYLLMYFFYSILGGAPALLGQSLIHYLPPLLQLFLLTFIKIYYTLISYHLMGYVILQYHQDIGYQVDFGDFKDEQTEKENTGAATDEATGKVLRRLDQLIKDGDHESACDFIESETNADGITDPLLSDRYFTLLKLTGATDRLLAHGIDHIDLMVHADDPLVPKSYFRAAQIFNDRLLDPQKAKKILNRLLATYPDHHIIPFVSRYLGQMG